MKENKPVPNMEALTYKGAPGRPDIKIFVSHRIDLDSETIDNPLYIPVRCGAVYDKRKEITMLGDDTGDNISEKRMTFNELTIQYWAWKNCTADYYGFCHYRRYLSFSKKDDYKEQIGETYSGCVVEPMLNCKAQDKYWLNDAGAMEKEISKYDVTVFRSFDVSKVDYKSVRHSMSIDSRFFDYHDMEKCIQIIQKYFPNVYIYAEHYLDQKEACFYNCFVMKKQLFYEFCNFQFTILFELEKMIDISKYSIHKQRVFGLIGEHLLGIYLYYLKNERKVDIKERQVVFFKDASKVQSDLCPAFAEKNNVVVLSSSNSFSPYLGVCIQSIIESSSTNNNYDIIVAEKSISKKNKDRILSLKKDYSNVSIRFLNVAQKVAGLNFYINGDRLSQETYYGLLMPWFLPRFSYAIIMDCDMIVKEDIAQLYAQDISSVMAGAVNDVIFQGLLNDVNTDTYEYCTKVLGIEDPYQCFNGGLIYLNMERFRAAYTLKTIQNYINHYKLRIVDQDIFNVLLQKQVTFLDARWNHMIVSPGWVEDNLSYAPASGQEIFQKARKKPYIIHYANVVKPWENPEVEFGDDFWYIAKHTPFYEMLLVRMQDEKNRLIQTAVYHVQNRLGFYDTRSGARKLADKLLPKGTHRREFAKALLPKDSLRWRFCKQIYYIIRPKYRPKTISDNAEDEEN